MEIEGLKILGRDANGAALKAALEWASQNKARLIREHPALQPLEEAELLNAHPHAAGQRPGTRQRYRPAGT